MACNDAILVGDKSVGGGAGDPPAHEFMYFLRLAAGHLFELSKWLEESIARYPEEITSFVMGLPEGARADLVLLQEFRTKAAAPGVVERLGRMRHLLFHYPEMLVREREAHDDVRAALHRMRDHDAEIIGGRNFRSTRIAFADDLMLNLIVGELPSDAGGGSSVALRAAVEPLAEHLRDGIGAAMRFGDAVVRQYLDDQPSERIQLDDLIN